ncbi:hypothetical protein [Microbaculum marinum]|uniref:Secreted protein n=1 Tax=Microbaculum marinum TaxID=1764581 RepID=A0AAW9RZS6_9HYPH
MHLPGMVRAALVGGMIMLSATGTATSDPAGPPATAPADRSDLENAYLQSIFQSAVKRPSYRKRLVPINATRRKVTVITLARTADVPDDFENPFPHTKGMLRFASRDDDTAVLGHDTWISLPREIGPKCKAAADPLLKLHMILGMPPQTGGWEMVRFRVSPQYIFRPCASDPSITTRHCSFDIPARPSGPIGLEGTQSFVFQQIWSSYTEGFKWPGYPFTGMGWSYNWDPDARTPYGISEYVVRAGSPVSNIRTFTPKGFCAAS